MSQKDNSTTGFNWCNNIIDLPEVVLRLLIAAMTILCLVGILFRYVLHFHVAGLDEMLKMLLVWVSFLGAAIALKKRSHFGVHVFLSYLPQSVQKQMKRFGDIVVVFFGITLLFTGIGSTKIAFRQLFVGLDISIGWQYVILPISGGLMCIYGIWSIFLSFRK